MCEKETFDHSNEHLNKKVDVSGTLFTQSG